MDATADMNISFFLIVGTLGMLLLAAAVVLFVFIYQKKLIKHQLNLQRIQAEYQRELLKATIHGQEKERKRIAQDLHDEVGAMLSAIRLSVSQIERNHQPQQQFKAMTRETKSLIDETIDNVRRISKDLLPVTLENFGLIHALEELANKLNASTAIFTSFDCDGESIPLERRDELAIYRVVQELCNNIIKHAGATKIDIKLRLTNQELRLLVIDNGSGFSLDDISKVNGNTGIGLKSIESRLNMLGGKITYRGKPAEGTTVSIELPY
ncbi:MAG: sensor histidine kinase [Cyclobacteriaceae bacterium]